MPTAPKKEGGAHTSSRPGSSLSVPVPVISIPTSSPKNPSLLGVASSTSTSSVMSAPIYERVARAFASIASTRHMRGSDLTIDQRNHLRRVFQTTTPVIVPTLLDPITIKAARPMLLGPKGEGYVLMDQQKEGDQLVNSGTYKDIFHAIGLHDGKNYVVAECDIAKIAAKTGQSEGDIRETLLREQFFAEYLTGSPGIMNIPLVVEAGGKFYFVMEFCRGGGFSELITNLKESGDPLPFQLRVGRELLVGLAATHEKDVIHRDLKPDNILLNDDLHAVLCDYGLATLTDDPSRLGIGRFVGTASFFAPETIRGTPQQRKLSTSGQWV